MCLLIPSRKFEKLCSTDVLDYMTTRVIKFISFHICLNTFVFVIMHRRNSYG